MVISYVVIFAQKKCILSFGACIDLQCTLARAHCSKHTHTHTHTLTHSQCVAGEKRWSSAWAEMVMQWSHHSRCDTLTVACCEKWGGRGGQPGLFLNIVAISKVGLDAALFCVPADFQEGSWSFLPIAVVWVVWDHENKMHKDEYLKRTVLWWKGTCTPAAVRDETLLSFE